MSNKKFTADVRAFLHTGLGVAATAGVEWIMVEDRLPTTWDNCWITLDMITVDNRVRVAKGCYIRETNSWCHPDSFDPIEVHEGEVIAWALID